ncbi:MAG: RluA family pseudouridine synthase [Caldilineaceae bacterium]|nr:RluA family pseudouridine synthase [Caldilineaceae bacterium]
MTVRTIVAQGLVSPTRLDRFLRQQDAAWGRQAVQQLISRRKVKVNGRPVWLSSWEIRNGDRVELDELPERKAEPPTSFDDSWLLADDGDIVAVNKPAGLLSEPTRWTQSANLLDLARVRFGPVTLFHRLDRDTSGLVLLTRGAAINRRLAAAFQQRLVEKEYIAVVATPNRLAPAGTIQVRLDTHPQRADRMVAVTKGGHWALTRYAVVAEEAGRQWVRLWPETGRTHQLRVHLAHLEAPILGDRFYGDANSAPRLMLHAWKIQLPATGDDPARSYLAPLPPGFAPPGSGAGP